VKKKATLTETNKKKQGKLNMAFAAYEYLAWQAEKDKKEEAEKRRQQQEALAKASSSSSPLPSAPPAVAKAEVSVAPATGSFAQEGTMTSAVASTQSVACGTCFEQYSERGEHIPLMMPCGHTYCSQCLTNLKSPKKCPTCRAPLPQNTPVSSLPRNFSLLELLAAMPPPAPPALEKRSLSSMTDEELDAYREQRRLQKSKNQEQASVLTKQKQEAEAQRHAVLQEAVELGAQIETSKQAYAKAKAELDALEAQALAKQQQEQGLAQQVASLEVEIDALLKNNNKKPAEATTKKPAAAAAVSPVVLAAREGVRISGDIGDNAVYVNGLYEVTDEISGGMPVYKKQGAEQWLEYHVSFRQWMSRSTARKGQTSDLCHAYVACAVGMLPDKAPKGAWHVVVNGAWRAQSNIVITPLSAAEVSAEVAAEAAALQAACEAARVAATYAVCISGATGSRASYVNGVYEVTDEVSGGMPVYKKQESDMWLEFHVSKSQWMSRRTASKGQTTDICHAYVTCAIGVLPDKAPTGAWHVCNDKDWQTQASVVVVKGL